RFGVSHMSVGAGGVKYDLDFGVIQNRLDTAIAGVHSERAGTGQPLRLPVDPGQQSQIHMSRLAQNLEHPIAADFSGGKNCDLDFSVRPNSLMTVGIRVHYRDCSFALQSRDREEAVAEWWE